MPGCHSLRWIALSLSALLPLGGCVGSTDSPQGETGSLSVDLVLADGIEIDEVGWQITGNGMDMSGDIDVSAPGSTASVEVFGLPPGETDYTVTLTATSTDQEVTCQGSAPFNVVVGQSTDVMVMLNCKKPRTLGGVRVNGKFNICTELTKAVVSPLQTSVGNDISLAAQAFDEEGDPITYSWTGDGGSIADPTAASTTYTCQEVGDHTVTIMVTDNDVYCRMATWTIPVTCVEGDGGDLCEDVVCEDDGNECTASECNPANGACETSNVADGTECDGGACSGGVCVEVDLCEGVDCNDNNECTADDCDATDGSCDNTNVDNGTPCNNDEGVCTDGSCVDVNLCEGVVCDDTGNECTVAMCNGTTGVCDTMNVSDGTECNGGSGACSAGVCIDNNLCESVDCTSQNDCVQDGTCDAANGECIAGANEPIDTACTAGGGTVCDGAGNCVQCNSGDQCPDDGNDCTAAACEGNTCVQNNVMDGEACDFDGSAGICEAGTCVAAPDCISPGDCVDGNPCTIGLCTDGMCSFDPVAGGSCDPGTGSGDGTCSNTGTCVSNDECAANTDCSDDDGNECTVPVCDQTGVPYVCDEDSAPADGNACDGGAGTCQGGACVAASPPYINAGTADTAYRAAPRLCSAGSFPFIDTPRADCALCLSNSCSGGSNNLNACTDAADCPGGQCVAATPGPDDCPLDCFTFVCDMPTDFLFPGGGPGGACVYPTGVTNCPFLGCEVVSNTLKNQLAIDTFLFMNVSSTGTPDREVTIEFDVLAVNPGLALAGPLANLNDVVLITDVTAADPSTLTNVLNPALQGTSVDAYTGTGSFVLSSPDQLLPTTEVVTPLTFPNVDFSFDETNFVIELVIKSSGAPLDITGSACTFSNEQGTCFGGRNGGRLCDPAAPDGSTGLADCTAIDPPIILDPGVCTRTDGAPITLGTTNP